MPFGFCVFGESTGEINEWASHWCLRVEKLPQYTNYFLPPHLMPSDILVKPKVYNYVDGFSPNLNKHLHLGHLSNLILAKSYQSLGVGDQFIAILGDTLKGDVDKEDALAKYKHYCQSIGYNLKEIFFASEQVLLEDVLFEGEGEYVGTKVFKFGDHCEVGIRSVENGSKTTYTYQDVALAQKLNAPTLYLTGLEQDNHFKNLRTMFPHINHVGLGLVTLKGGKMSSSVGNVIMAEEVLDVLNTHFNDEKLVWNVLSGQILKSAPSSQKKVDMDTIKDFKQSLGLYISYTQARMWSAGIEHQDVEKFKSSSLDFKFLKSISSLQPNILFEEVVEHCKKINSLYDTHIIKDNPENKAMFQELTNDLMLGCKKLGLFKIEKI